MTATLKDVAMRTGVSIKTVSNVVHGYVHIVIDNLTAARLLGRINGTRTNEPERVEVSFRLIVRESTVGLNGR